MNDVFRLSGNRHPDQMRDKLELAKRQNDRETLERLTDECIASGHLELIPDIQNARRTLDLWDGGRGGQSFERDLAQIILALITLY